jgi:hypothetical protein
MPNQTDKSAPWQDLEQETDMTSNETDPVEDSIAANADLMELSHPLILDRVTKESAPA